MGNPVVGAARRVFRWDHQMDPRIAWVSPMPPARSGIASYSKAVLAGLERIGYMRKHKLEPVWPVKQKHSATIPWHTMAVYHLGNNVEFHGDIYDLAIRVPGLLVIHDLALDDFVQGMIATGHPFGYPALREGLLNAGKLAGFDDAERNEPLRIPFIAHAARHARGIVAHSPFVERYLRAFGCRTPVFVAPHPVVERDEDVRAAERRAPVAPRLARDDGHADARRGVRRSERGQAHRRRARRRRPAAGGRARRPRRPAHPRVRARAGGARERARRSRERPHRRLGRGLPGLDVRRGHRRSTSASRTAGR